MPTRVIGVSFSLAIVVLVSACHWPKYIRVQNQTSDVAQVTWRSASTSTSLELEVPPNTTARYRSTGVTGRLFRDDMTVSVKFPGAKIDSSTQNIGFEGMGLGMPPGHGRWHKADKEYHFVVNRNGIVWYFDCRDPIQIEETSSGKE